MKRPPFRQSGFSKLEIIVVVIIVALVSGWLLHTLRFYQELTEKTVVESTIVNIRSAMRMQIAEWLLQGKGDNQAKLAKTNPISLLQQPPRGYMGELKKPRNLPPGSWYYEQDKSELVYIPALYGSLVVQQSSASMNSSTAPSIHWQVRMLPADDKGALAVDIELLTSYEWF